MFDTYVFEPPPASILNNLELMLRALLRGDSWGEYQKACLKEGPKLFEDMERWAGLRMVRVSLTDDAREVLDVFAEASGLEGDTNPLWVVRGVLATLKRLNDSMFRDSLKKDRAAQKELTALAGVCASCVRRIMNTVAEQGRRV